MSEAEETVKVDTAPKFDIRLATPDDINLILATWLRSYRFSSTFTQKITNKDYYTYHHAIAKGILSRPSCVTYTACDPLAPGVIYGYGVFEKQKDFDVTHFIYIKGAFRKFGIATALFKKSGFDPNNSVFTHFTFPMNTIKPKYPNLRYIPYAL